MIINYIWIFFLISAFLVALLKMVFFGDMMVFPNIMNEAFSMAKLGFELSLGLTGIMALWLGVMKIGEKSGAINIITKAISPLFNKLFPDLPKNHPVFGSMVMNFAANILGLDNAATPLGLKAMKELQELNPKKDTASNSMIMFLVINTSGLTLIPVSIIAYRLQLGASDPTDVFLPILICTFTSTFVGILAVAIYQRINLFKKEVILYLLGFSLIIAGIIFFALMASSDSLKLYSSLASNFILFAIIIIFISIAFFKKINVYDSFIEGAKTSFSVSIKIIPYIIIILVAIGAFRASGAMGYLIDGIKFIVEKMNLDSQFVDALPTAIMKPLSGGGARGLMVDTMNTFGVDSFAGRLSCIFNGATDTTFYIIALYFGSVGITNSRYALVAGLIADFAGITMAIFMGYLFFS